VFATDVMHRPDLGVDCRVLSAYWIAEARAGRMPWLKYLNWQGKQYRAKGYAGETVAFRTAWANSGHFDHIHLSVRTDYRTASLGSWSLTPGGGDDDMAFGDDDKARLVKIEAMFTNVYGWEIEDVNLARQVPALLAAIAAKVDVDPAELDAIKQAAAAGVVGALPVIVDAIIAKLPAGAMTRDDVEAAVRDAFAGGLAAEK
jgi:hypothetical protein